MQRTGIVQREKNNSGQYIHIDKKSIKRNNKR